MDCSKYIYNVSHRGRKEMTGNRELRTIEDKWRHDIRFMFLADHQRPSFMAFHKFTENCLKGSIGESVHYVNAYNSTHFKSLFCYCLFLFMFNKK